MAVDRRRFSGPLILSPTGQKLERLVGARPRRLPCLASSHPHAVDEKGGNLFSAK